MNEARISPNDPDLCIIPHPEMEGIVVEVQHTVGQGVATKEMGTLGVGVVMLPTGQPRVMLQMKHPDGSSMCASLKQHNLAALMECLVNAHQTATAMAAASDAAKAKAS